MLYLRSLKGIKSLIFPLRQLISKKKTTDEVDFLNLIKPAIGPIIDLPKEEKQHINKEIDRKMEELEATGLSREQILMSSPRKGIPLASDPFFQFLKRNKLAREIYIKVGERFTVEKVIQIALRQDIGPDPSYATIKKINRKIDQDLGVDDFEQTKVIPVNFESRSYNANEKSNLGQLNEELKPVQSLKYTYKPLEKYEKMKLKTRIIKPYDIHWRNIELISQFTSRSGCIRTRFATCLPVVLHKRVERAIKTARRMMMMPHYGNLPAVLRRNLTTLQQDVNELGKKQISLTTGHIYYKRGKSSDYRREQYIKANDPDAKFSKMMEEGPNYKLWLDSLKDEMKDEDFERKAKAQAYARHLKKKDLLSKGIELPKDNNIFVSEVDKRMGVRRAKPQDVLPQEEQDFKKAFEQRQKQYEASNIYDFAEQLLKQKTL